MSTRSDLTPKQLRHQYRRTLKFIENAKKRGGEMEEAYISVAIGRLQGILDVAPPEMQSEIADLIQSLATH